MTSRMDLAYVAMAALAVMISDVSAARAATQFCDIYPERCQYSGNGVYYYYPQGYRVGSAGTASGGGTWGCAATNGQNDGSIVEPSQPSRCCGRRPDRMRTGQYRRDLPRRHVQCLRQDT